MKRISKKHKSHGKHKYSFLKIFFRSIGIGKKKHRSHTSGTGSIGQEISQPKPKKQRKPKHRQFYFITRLFKKRHHRKSKSKLNELVHDEHKQPSYATSAEKHRIEFGQHKPPTKSKAKYKRAIKSKNRHEKRRQLKLKWRRTWQDTLYFLNLRSLPYDPFSRSKVSVQNKQQLMTLRQFAVYIFNSTVLFIITYIIAYLTYQFAVIFVSSFWGIDSVLYYYEVMFPIGNASPLWSKHNIILITISGPIVSLIMGMIYYKVFLPRDVFGPVTKLFFLWLSFHSFNLFFGAYVAGFITDQGFGYVVNWLYLRFFIKLALVMLSLFVMMVIGYYATKPLLETSNSLQRVSRENRGYFILTQMIVPWILGGLILILIKIPNNDPQHENIIVYDLIVLATLVFSIATTFFNKKAKPDSLRYKSKKRLKFVWLYMLIAILLIIAYRLGLDNGLHFIIRIMFRVAPYG